MTRLFARALVAVALLTACSDAKRTNIATDGRNAPLRKVRLAITPFVSQAPLMIARAEGFFRDEGLDVEFVSSLRSEESTVALVTGDLDVRAGTLSAGMLSAIVQGAPIKVTAGMGYLASDGCPYFGIVLRRGLDTAGSPLIKRMRASQDGASRFLLSKMLASRNMHLESIESVRLPEPVMVSSLQSGAVDAVAASEPLLTRAAQVGTRWISAQGVIPDFQWGVIAFSERMLERDHDLGVRFMRAYRRSVAQFLEGKTDRNVAIIAEYTGESPELMRQVCWPAFQRDSRINWGSVEAFQQWAVSVKLMERTLSPTQLWDSTFVAATDNVR